VTLRGDMVRRIRETVEWLTSLPDDALWPDELMHIRGIVDHIDGVDRSPPIDCREPPVTLKSSSGVLRWMAHETIRRRRTADVVVKPSGGQLVHHGRYVVRLARLMPERGVAIPGPVAGAVAVLERDVSAAGSLVRLGGQVT